MATSQCTKEAIWLRKLMADVGLVQVGATTIMCDNQGCIALAKNPTHHSRTKHIDIQHHFIRAAYITHVLSNLHLVETNWDLVSQQPQFLCIPIQVVSAMPFKVGRLKTLQFMKGCFLQYSSWQFFLCWFINILQTASVPAHGGNIILFDYHCFCWFQIAEFNVSGNPDFRDRSIQGESVGPEIPWRP